MLCIQRRSPKQCSVTRGKAMECYLYGGRFSVAGITATTEDALLVGDLLFGSSATSERQVLFADAGRGQAKQDYPSTSAECISEAASVADRHVASRARELGRGDQSPPRGQHVSYTRVYSGLLAANEALYLCNAEIPTAAHRIDDVRVRFEILAQRGCEKRRAISAGT